MPTIKMRRGLSSVWPTNNPILKSGELGVETDTHRLKIGDGTHAWNSLPYVAANVSLTNNGDGTWEDSSATVVGYTKAQIDSIVSGKIPMSQRGAANGVATLDSSGQVPSSQIPPAAFSGIYTPEQYGAPGGLTNDNGPAIRSALLAAKNAGGGRVMIVSKMGFKGTCIVSKGVSLESTATTTEPDNTSGTGIVVGLLALDGTSQIQVSETANGVAAALRNIFIDGNGVGSQTSPYPGLVRVYGVNTVLENVYTFRSGSDGLVIAGAQNSIVIGGQSTENKGVALVMDHGPGNVSFFGGYYGTSDGGAFLSCLRSESGMANIYPFGTSDCNWYGTIFESYNSASGRTYPNARHMEWRAGQNNVFHSCNFTGGAPNSLNSVFQINSADGGIPSIVTFDNCNWWGSSNINSHVLHIKGSQVVYIDGIQWLADDGTHHPNECIYYDTGVPQVVDRGLWITGGVSNQWAASSGTLVSNNQGETHSGTNHILGDPTSANGFHVEGFRKMGDAYWRYYMNALGQNVWFDGSSGVAKAILGLDSNNHLQVLGSPLRMSTGMILEGARNKPIAGTLSPSGASQTTAIDCSAGLVQFVSFYAPETINFTNITAGCEIEVYIVTTLSCAMTYQANGVPGNIYGSPAATVNGVKYLKFWSPDGTVLVCTSQN